MRHTGIGGVCSLPHSHLAGVGGDRPTLPARPRKPFILPTTDSHHQLIPSTENTVLYIFYEITCFSTNVNVQVQVPVFMCVHVHVPADWEKGLIDIRWLLFWWLIQFSISILVRPWCYGVCKAGGYGSWWITDYRRVYV